MLDFLFFLTIMFIILIPYLIGSIPVGLLLAKSQHKDITKLGSGGIGATNVTRNTSGTLGILTLLFDFLKGYFAVVFSVLIFHLLIVYDPNYFSHLFAIAYISGFFVVFGHCFSIYIKFKGGKGISTSGGVILAITPILFIITALVFIIIFCIYHIVSLSSTITAGVAGTFCFIPWFNYYYLQLINKPYDYYFHNILHLSTMYYWNVLGTSIILFFVSLLVIIKHKDNITRLLLKKERFFQIGKDDKTQADCIVKKNEK